MGRTAALKAQRRLARTILAILAALLLAFVLFASDPLSAVSVAQTPTNTASPTFTINFLNPSGHSEEISNKPDGSGGASENEYHLVAWVNQLPPDTTVEFRYDDPNQGGNETTIGVATQTAIPDTFEIYWSPPGDLDDQEDFTMHAVLFSGGTEVARDTESDIEINNQSPATPSPTSEERADTVEITDPANGEQLGFFTPRDRSTNAVIEVSTSERESAGPNSFFETTVFYTTSAPGTEPDWSSCGSEEQPDEEDGMTCTVDGADDASQITAVAASVVGSSDTASESTNDSGDAHRIAPYEQIPTSMSLLPAQQNEIAQDACSAPLTATLTDQNDEPIADADLDAHAVGPTDTLGFDGPSGDPPETGGHTEEAAWDCSTAVAPGEDPTAPDGAPPDRSEEIQGDHNLPDADRKHLESRSNDAGQWSFQLFSPDRGGTQITVFSDLDATDTHCSSEISADASVGWIDPAPAVTGVPEETSDCPSPSPSSPGPSPSESSPSPGPTDDPRGCTHFGSNDSEEINGTPGDDVICAHGGNDVIRGLGGDDVIYGDGGNDRVRGGDGNDDIHGNAGRDTLRGNSGHDVLDGDGRNDVLIGGGGNDRIRGRAGFDTLRGGAGRDSLVGAAGDDILAGGSGPDRLSGGRGRDILRGGPGRDRCESGPGRDDVTGCEN
ncbi:MAG: calcium-binding protein [Actinomycetota bacterium]